MTHENVLSRRTFVSACGALGALAVASQAAGTPAFAASSAAADGKAASAVSDAAGEKEVWGHCAINCPGRCSL